MHKLTTCFSSPLTDYHLTTAPYLTKLCTASHTVSTLPYPTTAIMTNSTPNPDIKERKRPSRLSFRHKPADATETQPSPPLSPRMTARASREPSFNTFQRLPTNDPLQRQSPASAGSRRPDRDEHRHPDPDYKPWTNNPGMGLRSRLLAKRAVLKWKAFKDRKKQALRRSP